MEDLDFIVAEIADNLNKHTDHMFKKRIENLVIGSYSTLISREYAKTGKVSNSLQTSIYLDMEIVKDLDDSPVLVTEDESKVYRSKIKIPSPVFSKSQELFMYVGSVGHGNPYMRIYQHEFQYTQCGTRFIRKVEMFSYIDGYIYTYNSKNQKLLVRAVFNDPRELLNYKNVDGSKCLEKVQIPISMKDTIRKMVYQELNPNSDNYEVELRQNPNAS